MAEIIVVICPTAQGERRAALWHDGQIGHGWHARVARRAQISSFVLRRNAFSYEGTTHGDANKQQKPAVANGVLVALAMQPQIKA
jgi:hypothetical protein